MTRPLTKTELFALTSAFARKDEADPFISFIVDKMVLGAGIGVLVAVTLLFTNAFGMVSLLRDVTDPFGHIVAFLVGGVMIFMPLTLAVAVGFAPYSE